METRTKKKPSSKLLAGFILNSRISDRKLADKLGISQPTVTRQRQRAMDLGILNFHALPEPNGIGMKLASQCYVTAEPEETEEQWSRRLEGLKNDSQIVFALTVSGSRKVVTFALHKNYTEYARFCGRHRISNGVVMLTSEPAVVGGKRMRQHLADLVRGNK